MPDVQSAYQAGEPAEFYQAVLTSLTDAGIPFAVGGTFAMEELAGLVRQTKDLDLFLRRKDWSRTKDVLVDVGIESRIEFAHWLGKACRNEAFVDLIFSSGNGLARVDDMWIARAPRRSVLGVPVRICAAEEMIWSKSFVMERERFDGADVLHILRHSGHGLDWTHLVERFGEHAGVLLAHLMLFLYVYPDSHAQIPEWVLDTLWSRRLVVPADGDRVCRGTLLSRAQYLVDIHAWGYSDGRLPPHGRMTEDQVVAWSAAVEPASIPSPR